MPSLATFIEQSTPKRLVFAVRCRPIFFGITAARSRTPPLSRIDFQPNEVAAPELAVNGQIEHRALRPSSWILTQIVQTSRDKVVWNRLDSGCLPD